MQNLTDTGESFVNDLSARYNLSRDAVIHMMVAVNNGGCSMAQFSSPELGGSGQWMRGGMTMVGDMFNSGLKNTVNNLCSELADGLTNMQIFPVIPAGAPNSNQWWPSEYGTPSSSGAQNDSRYAVFTNKLAVQVNGHVTIYDTLNHNIGGVSQQQGGNDSLAFTSQFGTISVSQLPVIPLQNTNETDNSTNFAQSVESQQPLQPDYIQTAETLDSSSNFVGTMEQNSLLSSSQNQLDPQQQASAAENATLSQTDSVIELIGKLAQLRDVGALTEDDFNSKKIELLARI